jgi:hypothetical protein
MDLPQLTAFLRYWDQAPPVHELFAAFVGYKAPGTPETQQGADDSDALLRDLAAAGIAIPPALLAEAAPQGE